MTPALHPAPEQLLSDRRLLYATAFLRALSTGTVGVLLGLYLARLGLASAAVGGIVTAGLGGATLAALLATLLGDRYGRRRLLLLTTILGAGGTVGLLLVRDPWLIACFAFLGMLNGMGRDRGAALILEQAALPALAPPEERTSAFAWYSMLQDIGHALGALLASLPALLEGHLGWSQVAPHQATLALTVVLGFLALILYARLGSPIDAQLAGRRPVLSPRSRGILLRLSALFAVDGLGGGFLTTTLLSFFFFERFAASAAAIGALFFGARILNALSHLAAAWLARRIGLVNTMVFTHIPSSLLLVTVAFAPSFPVAAILFLCREGLVEMDVPTRQSYVMALVAPEERTLASGVTNLVRLAAWAVAPAFAGLLMGRSLYPPLIIGAAMKISYDLLLWRSFRRIRPPEEQVRSSRP